MKLLTATVSALLVAGGASALDRYDVTKMSCNEMHAALQSSNRALLMHTSKHVPGMLLYGMYTTDLPVCKGGQTVVRRNIPATDSSTCPVLQCADNSRSMSRQLPRIVRAY
jgi:hypothetical protein